MLITTIAAALLAPIAVVVGVNPPNNEPTDIGFLVYDDTSLFLLFRHSCIFLHILTGEPTECEKNPEDFSQTTATEGNFKSLKKSIKFVNLQGNEKITFYIRPTKARPFKSFLSSRAKINRCYTLLKTGQDGAWNYRIAKPRPKPQNPRVLATGVGMIEPEMDPTGVGFLAYDDTGLFSSFP